MSFDGIVVRALVHELEQSLVGGRITKIHQPHEADLLLHIRSGGTNHRLLISANLSFPRMYLTDESFINPLEPPMFTMLLRKHIEGGLIQSIKQVNMERIIHIEISSRDELGDQKSLVLVIEIMGRHSNIVLVDLERQIILDGIHHVTPSISQYRQVMPGRPYISPPDQGKLNPLTVNHEQFTELFVAGEDPERIIVSSFQGISPLIAKEIVHRSTSHDTKDVWHFFQKLMNQITEHQYQPTIISGQKNLFAVIPLLHIEGRQQTFTSISTCLQSFYQKKAASDLIRQVAQDMLKLLNTERSKNKKKLEKLVETHLDAQKSEHYRIWGELLTSFQYQLTKGDNKAVLPNYYDHNESEIEIPLDPLLNPIENAQLYFKRYSKAKNSLSIVLEQIEKTKQEINYLDQLITQIELADQRTLDEIREELIEQGYVRKRNKQRKNKAGKANQPKVERYVSSEQVSIYVGKNNIQNDFLTNRLARANDTWLHTKDIPGSHVVISGEQFGEKTLHEAAMLAAYFSKARNSSSVPVDYTYIRHVRKPSGAKPGFVIYDHQKTLYVTPDEEWIYQLKREE